MGELSSAQELYDRQPTRWDVLGQVLSNKKAHDVAFQQHIWQMQQKAQELASGERKTQIAGQYGLEKQKLSNQVHPGGDINKDILAKATAIAQKNLWDLSDPEDQKKFQSTYQMLLSQYSGGAQGAMALATGQDDGMPKMMPDVPEPVGTFDPRRVLPGYADYGIQKGSGKQKLDADTAQKILQKAAGDKDKARAMATKLGYQF